MCNDLLYNVTIDLCAFNLPGVVEMKYTLAKWIQTYPALEDYDGDTGSPKTTQALTLSGDIVLDTTTYTDAAWFDIELEVDENSFTVTPQGKPGYGYYQTTFEGFVPTSDRHNTWALHKAAKSQLVMAVKDRSGIWRLIGHPDNPASLVGTYDTGKVAPDKVGFTLAGLWNAHAEPPHYYDGTF